MYLLSCKCTATVEKNKRNSCGIFTYSLFFTLYISLVTSSRPCCTIIWLDNVSNWWTYIPFLYSLYNRNIKIRTFIFNQPCTTNMCKRIFFHENLVAIDYVKWKEKLLSVILPLIRLLSIIYNKGRKKSIFDFSAY